MPFWEVRLVSQSVSLSPRESVSLSARQSVSLLFRQSVSLPARQSVGYFIVPDMLKYQLLFYTHHSYCEINLSMIINCNV